MTIEARKRLLDAAEACAAIAEFTRGKDFAAYASDRVLRSAVERQFEIVGEALGRAAAADASLETLLPELPRIVGLRNRIIHGYDSVDDEIIWDIVRNKLPALEVQLRGLLADTGPCA
jgi:uncharacterized protein with HEPN domain